MFTKSSRYRKIANVVIKDVRGRSLVSKDMRPLPQVSAIFQHTIGETDRLDHLAYRFYRQSRKWWRICDANPDFMNPQALLGKLPIVTDRFPVRSGHGPHPSWNSLLNALTSVVGVMDVNLVEEATLVSQQLRENGQPIRLDGKPVTIMVDQFKHTVVVTYNQMNTSATALTTVMTAAGFEVSSAEPISRVGKPIAIPQDS